MMNADTSPLSSSSLLDTAMRKLKSEAAELQQQRIFANNQKIISDLLRTQSVSTDVDFLTIAPCARGEAEERREQPIVQSESFEIDLGQITVPSSMGSGTLKDLVNQICRINSIECNEPIYSASFTSVVTALAGKHAIDDYDCTDVTQAEFVPVIQSGFNDKRVLVLCFSLNGETDLRIDHLIVRRGGRMPCIGGSNLREELKNTSMQAIEIPDAAAAQLISEHPNLSEALQKNACLITVIEYDLKKPEHTGVRESSQHGVQQSYRVQQCARIAQSAEYEIVEQSVGSSSQISSHSVVGQGSSVRDHGTKVKETGTRNLSNIQVFLVGAMVVNSNERQLSQDQCVDVANLMKKKVQTLNQFYLPYKTYTWNNLINELNNYLKKDHIDTQHTDIFEHSILRLGAIDVNPSKCSFIPSSSNNKILIMQLGISAKTCNTLITNLKQRFGRDLCEYTGERAGGIQCMQFSLEAISRIFPAIKQSIDEILSEPRNILAYQNFSQKRSPLYRDITKYFDTLMSGYLISIQKTDATEIVLLHMFGCKEELHHAKFQGGSSFIGMMLDVNFFLDISEESARLVIDAINQRFQSFSNPARFISASSRHPDIPGIKFCEIAIDGRLLCSLEFLTSYKATLNHLIENNPLLIEKLQINSGNQKCASHAARLTQLAQIHEKNVQSMSTESEPRRMAAESELAGSLRDFSRVITTKESSLEDRRIASDKIRRALGFFESTQSSSDNARFKKDEKAVIKDAQRSLNMR